jgi:tRNA(Arg) A34 adenosine deaminase TadA
MRRCSPSARRRKRWATSAISHARLRRLYFAAEDAKGGAVEHGPRLFAQPTCLHRPEVYGGIRASEAAEMLRAFFRARRG